MMLRRGFRPSRSTALASVAIFMYLIHRTMTQDDDYNTDEDYPQMSQVPTGLSFSCNDKLPGYYADPETNCQVWHWCVPGLGGNVLYSFLCGPGTLFNQRTRVCDWADKVDCVNAQSYYSINNDLYKDDAGNYIAGKKTYFTSRRKRVTRQEKRTRNKPAAYVTAGKKVQKFNVLPKNLSKRLELKTDKIVSQTD